MRRRSLSGSSTALPAMAAVTAFALIAAACGTGESNDVTAPTGTADGTDAAAETTVDGTANTTTATTAATATEPAPITAAPDPAALAPPSEQRLVVSGPEETVFDWTTDRCADRAIPDTNTRVVRGADGLVSLYISNETTYRMTGPDLDTLTIDCSTPVMTSAFDSDPSQFNDREWLSTTFTEDGDTVYGIVHNEYLGLEHRDAFPGQCPSGDNFNCIDVSLTLAISNDGGATFTDAAPAPDHMIATMPYVYDDEGVASGFWHPSNLIDPGDGYRYMLMDIATTPAGGGDVGNGWICALRTDDVSDPDSWRFWNGESFDGVIIDPYRDDVTDSEICTAVDFPALSAELTGSIVWVESIEQYVTVGGSFEPGTDQQNWGIYYATSTDLIDWSPRRLLFESPLPRTQAEQADLTFLAYPTVIDPDSESRNFDTTDSDAYLYATRFNFGGNSLDRDLIRIPIAFEEVVFEQPLWTFDTDGDADGWEPMADLSELAAADGALTMTSSGDDPHMVNTGLRIPAGFDQIEITMTATAGGPTVGQVFFLTEDDDEFDQAKFMWFDVVGNGKPQTYTIDMSDVAGWSGVITALRIDPVEATPVDSEISIDSITVSN